MVYRIYVLRDPRDQEVRYVGRTKQDLKRRLRVLCEYGRSNDPSHPRWGWVSELLNLGLKPVIELLEEVDEESAKESKLRWTEILKPTIANRKSVSPETKARISANLKGRTPSLSNRESHKTPEAREQARKRAVGRVHSAETRQKMSQSHKARISTIRGPDYKPPARYKKWRQAVLDRDGAICKLCGESIDLMLRSPDSLSFVLDHIRPKVLGGSDTLENLRPAHRICNGRRGFNYIGIVSEDTVLESQCKRYSLEYREHQRKVSLEHGARPPSGKGRKWTEEQRRKFTDKQKGRKWTATQRAVHEAQRKTPEWKAKQKVGLEAGRKKRERCSQE